VNQPPVAVPFSHDWWRVILDSIGDAVIATDSQGRVVFLNRIAQDLTGWSSAEANAGHCKKSSG
jgi:PAS domain S-box-containing protein